MRIIEHLFPTHIIEALGWTIIHTIWQGALVAIILGILLILLRKKSSIARYWISVASLMVILILAILTFTIVYNGAGITTDSFESREGAGLFSSDLMPAGMDQQKEQTSWGIFIGPYIDYFYRNLPAVVGIWIIGMLFFGLKFFGGYIYSQRLKHARSNSGSIYWQNKLDHIASKMKYRKTITFLESRMTKIPMVIGHIKPVILFPAEILTGIPYNQVELILAHEIAHIIRKDALINLVQSMLEVLLFYHPGVWWISSMIRLERENVCDDIAIHYNKDSLSYIKALARLEEYKQNTPAYAFSFLGHNNKLLYRIKRIMGQKKSNSKIRGGVIIILLLVISGIFLSANNMRETNTDDRQQDEIKWSTPAEDNMNGIDYLKISNSDNFIHETEYPPEQDYPESPRKDSLKKIQKLESEIKKLKETIEEMEQTTESVWSRYNYFDLSPDSIGEDDAEKLLWHYKLQQDAGEESSRIKDLEKRYQYQRTYNNRFNHSILDSFKAAQDDYNKALKELQYKQQKDYQQIFQEYQDRIKEIGGDSLNSIIYGKDSYFDHYLDSSNIPLPLLYWGFDQPMIYYDQALELYEDRLMDFDSDVAFFDTYYDTRRDFEDVYLRIDEELLEQEQFQNQMDILQDFREDELERQKELIEIGIHLDEVNDRVKDIDLIIDVDPERYIREEIRENIRERIKHKKIHDRDLRLIERELILMNELKNELINDGLAERHQLVEIEFTPKSMHIDGVKQPKKVFKKYRGIYEDITQKDITKKFILSL